MSLPEREARERAKTYAAAADIVQERALTIEGQALRIESNPPMDRWMRDVATDHRMVAKELRKLETELRELAEGPG